MYKAGARIARTGTGGLPQVRRWCMDSRLPARLVDTVVSGWRAEQRLIKRYGLDARLGTRLGATEDRRR